MNMIIGSTEVFAVVSTANSSVNSVHGELSHSVSALDFFGPAAGPKCKY